MKNNFLNNKTAFSSLFKLIFLLLVIVCALVSFCSVFVGADEPAYAKIDPGISIVGPGGLGGGGSSVSYYSFKGAGTESNPYIISTSTDLSHLAFNVNNGQEYSNTTYFKMQNSIDLSGVTYTPIGNSTYAFRGVFDGNNYSITNLSINSPASTKYVGLFARTYGATIKNLIVYGSVEGGKDSSHVGGIVGYTNATTFSGIVSFCDVSGGDALVYAGGIAGFSVGCKFENCANYGKVENYGWNSEDYYYAGGICGMSESSNKSSFDLCKNFGTIVCGNSSSSEEYVFWYVAGGICGCHAEKITCSFNSGLIMAGNVYATEAFAGGICGYGTVGEVSNCFNRANVSAFAFTWATELSSDFSNNTAGAIYWGKEGNRSYYQGSVNKDTKIINAYAYGICKNATVIDTCYNYGSVAGGEKEVKWLVHVFIQRKPSLFTGGGYKSFTVRLTYCFPKAGQICASVAGDTSRCYYLGYNKNKTSTCEVNNENVGEISYANAFYKEYQFSLANKSYKFYINKLASSNEIILMAQDPQGSEVNIIKHCNNQEAKDIFENQWYIKNENDFFAIYGESKASLPIGLFSTTVWDSNSYINSSYPYLKDMYW